MYTYIYIFLHLHCYIMNLLFFIYKGKKHSFTVTNSVFSGLYERSHDVVYVCVFGYSPFVVCGLQRNGVGGQRGSDQINLKT